jgi:hypothetical protein
MKPERFASEQPARPLRETDLYAPVKAFLEGQGYAVKGEVGAADVVAVRGDEPPVIVELKTRFSLALFHQAIDRLAFSASVYVAVPPGQGRAFQTSLRANLRLCRRLGVGLLLVRTSDGVVEARLDPGPYQPRQSKQRSARLLAEFSKRVGDPNDGGMTRATIMTAYRQDALRCLAHLAGNGPTKAAHVATATGVARARTIMADDHYGWFARVATGIYGATPKGQQACVGQAERIAELMPAKDTP